MKYDLNTHVSASAIAKLLGIEFTQIKEFKELLEASDLKTVSKSNVIKNRTIDYVAYDIIEAINYAFDNIEGNHIKKISIDIDNVWMLLIDNYEFKRKFKTLWKEKWTN